METAIAKLETLLEELEDPEADLNTAMDKYADSLKLAEKTFKDLEKAEQKLEVLNTQRDTLFDLDNND